jgi:2-octaprenyl-6-methoxyphenol hydroxylase
VTSLDHDIAICGAGPVGLALAAMLVRRGMPAARVVLIDARPLEQAIDDPRSIAVSWGSRQLLDDIGAWPDAADPIHDIHVSRRGHFGRTIIDRDDYGVPALGYVTRYGALVAALANVVGAFHVPSIRPSKVVETDERDDCVELLLDDGRRLTAALAVQAEGGLFSDQQAKALRRDYGQTAIVAHVHASRPAGHRAFERFTDEGPLALLPQEGGYALVWCGRPATVDGIMALSDEDFLGALQKAFGERVGRFTRTTRRIAYPLGLNAHPAATARTVAIGNAAQTLHPVAGQGFNLGLRDAAVLARLVAREATPGQLTQFAAARQVDRSLTITLTDAMARAFATTPVGAMSQHALGMALSILDTLKPAKKLLAEHMMFGQR